MRLNYVKKFNALLHLKNKPLDIIQTGKYCWFQIYRGVRESSVTLSRLRVYFDTMTNDVRLITFNIFPLNDTYTKKNLYSVYFYISQYELKRQQLIEENQKLLKELGLGPGNDLAPNEMKQFKVYKRRILITI